jgi:diguanylate cyclase (GGDEF)-like protein
MQGHMQDFFVKRSPWITIPVIVAVSIASSVGALFLLTELMGMGYGPTFRRSLMIAVTAPTLVSAPIGGYIVYLLREVEVARRQAQALAWNDELTRLMNRRRFTEIGTRELALAQRGGRRLVAVLLDVDDFKRVNDVHGHAGGDRLLRALGRALPAELRSTDLVSRWGGEEFALLMPETGAADAAVRLDALRQAVERLPSGDGEDGLPCPCTVSIGLTEAMPGDSFDTLVDRADKAMYQAKAAGKNRVVIQRA